MKEMRRQDRKLTEKETRDIIRNCGSLKASLYSTLEPVTGVFVGVTFYHEAVDQMGFMGIILILASVIGLSIFGD